jgi:small conductance mechanosensitive channel
MDFPALLRDVPVSAGVIIVLVLTLRLADRIMERRVGVTQFTRHLTMASLAGMFAFTALIALPDSIVSDSEAVRLVGVMGGVLITLSSTTLLANAMAGFMMRNVKSFNLGDFIEVEDYIGRVSQRGLYHIEIQTAQSDLVTLPNQFLITRPLRVVRASGTFIKAEVSLGYDTPHQRVEPLLIDAAERAGLERAFVQIVTLGDYTVTYRVVAFLDDVKTLFTARSTLLRRVLDALHEADVEIASPMLMGHRTLPTDRPLVPEWDAGLAADAGLVEADHEPESPAPSEIIFDKADEAVVYDRLSKELEQRKVSARDLEARIKKAEPDEKDALEEQLASLTRETTLLEAELEAHRIDDEVDAEARDEI